MLLKPYWFCLALTLAAPTIVLAGETSAAKTDYAHGRRLAELLQAGCVAVAGEIAAAGDPQPQPGSTPKGTFTRRIITLKNLRSAGAHQEKAKEIQVPFYGPPQTRETQGPWEPWQGLDPKPGQTLLLVRWPENAKNRPQWMGVPQDVALVISDKTKWNQVVAVVHQIKRFAEASKLEYAKEMATAFRILGDKKEPLFAGFLVEFLCLGGPDRDVNVDVLYLTALLGVDTIPHSGQMDIGGHIMTLYSRLTEPVAQAVMKALVAAGVGDNRPAADAAIRALVWLCDDKDSIHLKSHLDPARQKKLADNYQRAVEEEIVRRNSDLDRLLGFIK
jgi:hypothetical protein